MDNSPERAVSSSELSLLNSIIHNTPSTISKDHPENQLGKYWRNNDVQATLESLTARGLLEYDPNLTYPIPRSFKSRFIHYFPFKSQFIHYFQRLSSFLGIAEHGGYKPDMPQIEEFLRTHYGWPKPRAE